MIQTLQALLDAVAADDLLEHRHPNIELKQSWAQDYGKKLSALANRCELGAPGWLIVGVDDSSGRPVGNTEAWAKKTEETVSQHINQYLDPSNACKAIWCRSTATGWILLVEVTNPGALTYWNQGAYKGAGTTIREMESHEILEATVRLPGLSDYSKQPWTGGVHEEGVRLFASMVCAHRKGDGFVAGLDTLPPAEVLARMRIANTNVARVLFGDARYRLVWLGTDGTPIKNDQYGGGVFALVTPRLQQMIQDWTARSLGVMGNAYPPLALREAFANAVAHAAYFENDGELIIEISPNRITISNLCLRESSYFANKWFSGAHKTVNGLLMETLRQCGVVDELGRGKHLIFRESLFAGKQPPAVFVDPAGRYGRWRLVLHGGSQSDRQLRLFDRLKGSYDEAKRALVAHALVLWRDQPLSALKKHIDAESLPFFTEVLNDARSPVFYFEKDDSIHLRRWARVLLGEGKDSKKFSEAEEINLFWTAYRIHTQFKSSLITNKDFRMLADMGDTPSEITLASTVLTRWATKGWVKRVKKGEYNFPRQEAYEARRATEETLRALRRVLTD